MLKQSARGQNESKGDLQISEELSPHDALQQHVQVCTVLEASHQVHHEAAVALCLNLLLSLHMCLDVSTEACAVTGSLPVYVKKGLTYGSEADTQMNGHAGETYRQADRQAGT